MPTFSALGLAPSLCRHLEAIGYAEPTPIQREALPPLLAGRDLLGLAPTGTGKTAAFALPLLQHLAERPPATPGRPLALVLAPTRELATQLTGRITAYASPSSLRTWALYGGVDEGPQLKALDRGVEILVATPGRLLDLLRRDALSLEALVLLVLDEADRMLDLGFEAELRSLLAQVPGRRQTAFFSATLPHRVSGLAAAFLDEPVRVEASEDLLPQGLIEQKVLYTRASDKRALLAWLLENQPVARALVFVRRRQAAESLASWLQGQGERAEALHGERTQAARTAALEALRQGDLRLLVATEVMARGIDVEGITHVFNVELPRQPEDYVHRIGRTGRAGRTGVALSFCDDSEGGLLRDIERRIGAPLVPDLGHPFHWHDAIPGPKDSARGKGRKARGDRRKGRGRPRR